MRPWVIIVVWLAFTGVAAWSLEGRYLFPVKPGPASALPSTEKGKVSLTVAWGFECACSQDEAGHLADLAKRYSASDFQLKVLLPCRAGDSAKALKAWQALGIAATATADPLGAQCKSLGLTATPSAIVQGRDGQIIYRGSLHAGRFCHNDDLAFAAKAIDAAIKGQEPNVKDLPFYGCAIAF